MASRTPHRRNGFWRRQVLYPDRYTWFVFVSILVLLLTGIVLYRGGWEVNWVADQIIQRYGRIGIVVFKLGIVVFVIFVCEWVGRRRRELGRRLATWAVALPAIAVVLAFFQLLAAR